MRHLRGTTIFARRKEIASTRGEGITIRSSHENDSRRVSILTLATVHERNITRAIKSQSTCTSRASNLSHGTRESERVYRLGRRVVTSRRSFSSRTTALARGVPCFRVRAECKSHFCEKKVPPSSKIRLVFYGHATIRLSVSVKSYLRVISLHLLHHKSPSRRASTPL